MKFKISTISVFAVVLCCLFFSSSALAAVTITSPNGGEIYKIGNTIRITWSSDSPYGNMGIYFGSDVLGTSKTVTPSVSIATGYYDWRIPSDVVLGSTYKITVYSPYIFDASNNYFRITGDCITDWQVGAWSVCGSNGQRTRTVNDSNNCPGTFADKPATTQVCVNEILPNGGESYKAGDTVSIKWQAKSNGAINLYYYINNDSTTLYPIVSNISATSGSYNWVIPSSVSIGNNYKIYVYYTGEGGGFGTSNNYFAISQAPDQVLVTITSPNGGETFKPGDTVNVTWQSTLTNANSTQSVLLVDETNLSNIITTNIGMAYYNSRSNSWTIPSTIPSGSKYKIRVSSYDDNKNLEASDLSNNYFTIENCISSWQAQAWSSCVNNVQTKTFKDLNSCLVPTNKPQDQTQNCGLTVCSPIWQPQAWSSCVNGQQTRTVNDGAGCTNPSVIDKPATTQTCPIVISPNGGETLRSGYNYNITWQAIQTGTVKISIVNGDNNSTYLITAGTNASLGYYAWQVPYNFATGSKFKIVVSYNANYSEDYSDNYFTITSEVSCVPYWQPGEFSACANGMQTAVSTDTACSQGSKTVSRVCSVAPISVGGGCADSNGYITLNGVKYYDTCVPNTTDNMLQKYFCNAGNKDFISVPCQYGCLNGACLNAVASTFPDGCTSTSGYSITTGQPCTGGVTATICVSNWQAQAWTDCINGIQTRVYTDTNKCAIPSTPKPSDEVKSCYPAVAITSASCIPNWEVSSWEACVNNQQQYRKVTDLNKCNVYAGKPTTAQACTILCTPNWIFSDWSTCTNGQQLRVFVDTNFCKIPSTNPWIFAKGTSKIENRSCTSGSCIPSWQTTAWSTCLDGQQNRKVTDNNSCGITTNKPTESQTCCGYTNGGCCPNWKATVSSACVNNQQSFTVVDLNNCGVLTGKPKDVGFCSTGTSTTNITGANTCITEFSDCEKWSSCDRGSQKRVCKDINKCRADSYTETRQCFVDCDPSWKPQTWSNCDINQRQKRTYVDENNCGVLTGKPKDEYQQCKRYTCSGEKGNIAILDSITQKSVALINFCSNDTLIKYYCSNYAYYGFVDEYVKCPLGCQNGACK